MGADRDLRGKTAGDQRKRRILFLIRLVDFDAIRMWKLSDADTVKRATTIRMLEIRFAPCLHPTTSRAERPCVYFRLDRDVGECGTLAIGENSSTKMGPGRLIGPAKARYLTAACWPGASSRVLMSCKTKSSRSSRGRPTLNKHSSPWLRWATQKSPHGHVFPLET